MNENYPMDLKLGFSNEQNEKIKNLNSTYDTLIGNLKLLLKKNSINPADYSIVKRYIDEAYKKRIVAIYVEPKINKLELKLNSIVQNGLTKAFAF